MKLVQCGVIRTGRIIQPHRAYHFDVEIYFEFFLKQKTNSELCAMSRDHHHLIVFDSSLTHLLYSHFDFVHLQTTTDFSYRPNNYSNLGPN